jgi:hypothetical protein
MVVYWKYNRNLINETSHFRRRLLLFSSKIPVHQNCSFFGQFCLRNFLYINAVFRYVILSILFLSIRPTIKSRSASKQQNQGIRATSEFWERVKRLVEKIPFYEFVINNFINKNITFEKVSANKPFLLFEKKIFWFSLFSFDQTNMHGDMWVNKWHAHAPVHSKW